MDYPTGSLPASLTPTPDDGRRFSDVAPWDETTRAHRDPDPSSGDGPPRPGHRGLAAAQSLLDVHRELRTQLAQVRALVTQVANDQVTPVAARSMLNRMALRARDWATGATCAAYCNLVAQHHFGEDAEIFPYLRDRDAGLAPVLDRLEMEHVVIHELLDAVDAALVALVDDASPGATDLTRVVDRLTDALVSHLAYEERELLLPMSRAFG